MNYPEYHYRLGCRNRIYIFLLTNSQNVQLNRFDKNAIGGVKKGREKSDKNVLVGINGLIDNFAKKLAQRYILDRGFLQMHHFANYLLAKLNGYIMETFDMTRS